MSSSLNVGGLVVLLPEDFYGNVVTTYNKVKAQPYTFSNVVCIQIETLTHGGRVMLFLEVIL